MSTDEIDGFSSWFRYLPASRRDARRIRAKEERRTCLTEKQLRRRPVRTEQINFRCSPDFIADVQGLKGNLGERRQRKVSTADLLEEALELLKRKHQPKGTSGCT